MAELEILEQKESKLPYVTTPDYAPKSFSVVFKGITRVCKPNTIEMKISRSRNPKELGLSMTYEEYPLPKDEEQDTRTTPFKALKAWIDNIVNTKRQCITTNSLNKQGDKNDYATDSTD